MSALEAARAELPLWVVYAPVVVVPLLAFLLSFLATGAGAWLGLRAHKRRKDDSWVERARTAYPARVATRTNLIVCLLFALLFVSSGFMVHLGSGGKEGREYARSLGAPAPDLLVPLSGVTIIVGGLMVALGLWADLGALLIIGFLVGITPIMHAFWKIDDPQMKAIQSAMFFKNTALAGAAVIVFYIYNQGQDLDLSVTDALFGRI